MNITQSGISLSSYTGVINQGQLAEQSSPTSRKEADQNYSPSSSVTLSSKASDPLSQRSQSSQSLSLNLVELQKQKVERNATLLAQKNIIQKEVGNIDSPVEEEGLLSSREQIERRQEENKTEDIGEKLSSRIAENSDAKEQQVIDALQKRDRGVRAHEKAHASTGGAIAGPATYTYEVGPDGGRYAVHGKVDIDVTPEATPAATIKKMQQVRAAALAPVDPSPADRRAAANATRIQNQAQAQLLKGMASEKRDDQFESSINKAMDDAIEREKESSENASKPLASRSDELTMGPTPAELKMRVQTYNLIKAMSSIVASRDNDDQLGSPIRINV